VPKAKALYLIRGLPGVGKGSVAVGIPYAQNIFSMEDFFSSGPSYQFVSPLKFEQSNWTCRSNVKDALTEGYGIFNVVVMGTFAQGWEIRPYAEMAEGIEFIVKDLYDGGMTDEQLAMRNSRGISQEQIASIRNGWEANWETGKAKPPTKRK